MTQTVFCQPLTRLIVGNIGNKACAIWGNDVAIVIGNIFLEHAMVLQDFKVLAANDADAEPDKAFQQTSVNFLRIADALVDQLLQGPEVVDLAAQHIALQELPEAVNKHFGSTVEALLKSFFAANLR